jgi:hypothetical protein
MNIEISSRVPSHSRKHGSIQIAMSEPSSSNDATLDEILPMYYAYVSKDQSVQYEEVCDTSDVSMKNSAQYVEVHSLKCIFSEISSTFRSKVTTTIIY